MCSRVEGCKFGKIGWAQNVKDLQRQAKNFLFVFGFF